MKSRAADGLPPAEMWGVATTAPVATKGKPIVKRSEPARARRRAKRAAAREGLTLKAYLRGLR